MFANLAEFLPDFQGWADRYVLRGGFGRNIDLPNKIVAVGHRGTKFHAPENTIAAHETAYKLGARSIEFDVRCTSDDQFVVFHDHDVERTTDGKGNVIDLTLAELQKFCAKSAS